MMDLPVLEERADVEYQRAQRATKRAVSTEGRARAGKREDEDEDVDADEASLPATRRRSCFHEAKTAFDKDDDRGWPSM
jgi:hypothetical protein